MSKYEFEVWNSISVHTMDITSLVQNVRFTMQRNDAEQLDFDMSLTAFEDMCTRLNEDPRSALRPYTTDIKVKRNGQYLFGTQVAEITPSADESGIMLNVSCDGYLSLLTDRYTSNVYTATDSSDIAWDIIDTTNQIPYSGGDTGITRGLAYNTGFPRDRTYDMQNIRDAIVNLTSLEDHVFDFDFTHERVFNTYEKLGSDRPDITINYPATNSGINARSMRMTRSARGALYNWIIGIGSGFGEEALTTSVANTSSIITFGARQKIITYNGVSEFQTLDDNVRADLYKRFDILRLPEFEVSGEDFDLNDIKIGDRIQANQQKYKLLLVEGTYRIEKIDVNLNENFDESIRVTLDNWQI